MNKGEWRKRKLALRSVSVAPVGYWWEKRLDLADKEQLKKYIQVLLADIQALRAGLIGTVSDDEIRDMIKWKYGWIGTTNGDIARIIFEIVCSIRNVIVQPESAAVINLRERLDSAERKAAYLAKQLEESELHKEVEKYKDMFKRLCAVHEEDVRRRKETRRFRAANFSIAELEAALARKKAKQPLLRRRGFAELAAHWPSLADCPDGADILREKYGAPTGEPGDSQAH